MPAGNPGPSRREPDRAGRADGRAGLSGFAVPVADYLAPTIWPRFSWLLTAGAVVMSAAVVVAGLDLWLTPKIAHYMCPPDCGRPPTGTPVMALPRFTAPGFSVAHPRPVRPTRSPPRRPGSPRPATGGDGGVMQLFSEPANGRSPRDIVKAAIRRTHPNAKVDYEIPNAMVGYQPGYGEVADPGRRVQPPGTRGSASWSWPRSRTTSP